MRRFKKKIYKFKTVAEPTEIYSAQISQSNDVYELIKEFITQDEIVIQEYFWCVFLNRANNVIGYDLISIGGVSATLVDTKIIFKKALDILASGIIIVHNHPSGKLKPGNIDVTITTKIKSGCKLLDIDLIDHLILTDESYFSFMDEGLI